MSVSTYGQKVLIDAGDRRNSVEPNAPTTIGLIRDQNEKGETLSVFGLSRESAAGKGVC